MSKSQKRLIFLIALALGILALGQVFGTFRAFRLPQTPERFQSAESEVCWVVTGTVIRQEQVVYAPKQAWWQCRLENGQQAAAGEALFTEGQSAETRRLASRLGAARQSQTLKALPLPQRRTALREAIGEYQQGGHELTLLALMLSEGTQGEAVITETESALSQSLFQDQAVITAPVSGIFSSTADGLEEVLTPEQPYGKAQEVSPLALGRLITSDTWYFSVCLPFSAEEDDRLEAELLGGGFGRCTLRVETIARSGKGFSALLSCNENLEAVASIRDLTVRLSKP